MLNTNARLKIDAWYKLVSVFGMILAILAIVIQPTFISSKGLLLMGLGMFITGIGEWKEQYYKVGFIDASAFNPFIRVNTPVRKTSAIGTLFIIVGALLIIWSMTYIFNIAS